MRSLPDIDYNEMFEEMTDEAAEAIADKIIVYNGGLDQINETIRGRLVVEQRERRRTEQKANSKRARREHDIAHMRFQRRQPEDGYTRETRLYAYATWNGEYLEVRLLYFKQEKAERVAAEREQVKQALTTTEDRGSLASSMFSARARRANP